MAKYRLKKGDKVTVIAGKDKGKQGEIIKVLTKNDRVLVNGVNVAKRHTKASMVSQGGIVDKNLSVHISNVAITDPKSDKPSRVRYKILENNEKVRIAKRSGEVLA